MKQSNTERLGVQESVYGVALCNCGVGRKVFQKLINNENSYNGVILTWFLKGNGVFSQGGKEYILADYSVCMRNAETPYTMQLVDDDGPRLFLSIHPDLFRFLCILIPELKHMPPVWECSFSQEVFDAFFVFYEHIKQISSNEFYQALPELVQYILLVTGIQNQRDISPLEKGRQFLEDNQSISLEEIAEKCGMTYHTFRKQFVKQFGISPGRYRIHKRIDKAALWLEQGISIMETAEMLGYPDIYAFSHQFHAVKGLSPSKYCSYMRKKE